MRVKVEFTKDYANKNKGDVETYYSQLACGLIEKKVAKVYKAKVKKQPKKEE